MLARLRELFRSRRRREALWLAMIACGSVASLRLSVQPAGLLIAEGALFAVACLLVLRTADRLPRIGSPLDPAAPLSPAAPPRGDWRASSTHVSRTAAVLALLATPVGCAIVSRWCALQMAWELVGLSVLGGIVIALVLAAERSRTISLSVGSGGFLVLFTAAISEQPMGLGWAAVWAFLCLRWLVANHWERLEVCLIHSARREAGGRLLVPSLLGVTVAVAAGLAVWGRGATVWDRAWGIMPTSGGHDWTDPAARSGVGDGDAVIAAREHAASFGPVESELFLDSEQSSLFDVFNDMLGEPLRKVDQQRAVALSSSAMQPKEPHGTESQQGEQSFTTLRQPRNTHGHPKARRSTALLHWIGTAGERLALERFDTFDGAEWTQSADLAEPQLQAAQLEDRVWFFGSLPREDALFGATLSHAVKIINLRSQRIPAPAATAGIHIADVEQADFFAIAADGSWCMPVRDAVPSLTVIRQVSCQADGDVLESLASLPARTAVSPAETAGLKRAAELAAEWTAGVDTPWARVQAIVGRLRSDFTFDRNAPAAAEDPLAEFLRVRRGGDHLFATAAAAMLQALGYQARLVTGFYADPEDFTRSQQQTTIGPEDAHVWVEVAVRPHVWVPIEPTPGYSPPQLYRSFASRLRQTVWAGAPWAAALAMFCLGIWRSRAVWGNAACVFAWRLSRPLSQRRRMRVLMWVLDTRCLLARRPRPAGVPQRRWFARLTEPLEVSLNQAARRCFDAADVISFCGTETVDCGWLSDADLLARRLTVQQLELAVSHSLDQRNLLR